MANSNLIRADYERLWDSSQEPLRQGKIDPDPVPDDTSKRWGMSVIVRPSGEVAERLSQEAEKLAAFTGRHQVVYNTRNLHATVRSIEFFRSQIAEDDSKMISYRTILHRLAKEFTNISISYRGLTANTTGIMAQGWPEDDALQTLRDRFHEELAKHDLLGGPEAEQVRRTAHASLVVFTHPLHDPVSLADYVVKNRDTDYGTAEITSIELIRYVRTMTDVQLVRLDMVKLG